MAAQIGARLNLNSKINHLRLLCPFIGVQLVICYAQGFFTDIDGNEDNERGNNHQGSRSCNNRIEYFDLRSVLQGFLSREHDCWRWPMPTENEHESMDILQDIRTWYPELILDGLAAVFFNQSADEIWLESVWKYPTDVGIVQKVDCVT